MDVKVINSVDCPVHFLAYSGYAFSSFYFPLSRMVVPHQQSIGCQKGQPDSDTLSSGSGGISDITKDCDHVFNTKTFPGAQGGMATTLSTVSDGVY